MAKPLIMVVDDEKEFADNVGEIIKNTQKYEAVVAYSAREAFKLLRKNKQLMGILGNKIKLILLDIKMPDLDGLQFLAEMRNKYRDNQIGVIMLTAYEDREKWDKATAGFIVGYIKKTDIRTSLLSSIERFFSDPNARYNMTLDTFEKHIDKMAEFKKSDH